MPVQFGTFTIGVDAGDKKARQNTETIYVYSTFEDLLKRDICSSTDAFTTRLPISDTHLLQANSPREIMYPISGHLHTGKIVAQYLDLRDDGLDFQERDKVHSRAIVFTTTLNGSVKPSFSIAPVTKGFNTISGNLDLTADRMDQHQVTVRLRPQSKIGGTGLIK